MEINTGLAAALLVLGLVAGVASGMFGIGGGAVIVPVLMLLGFSQLAANGTSLAALLLPVGALAVARYFRAGLLDVRAALLLAGGLLVGGWLGAQVALGLPPLVLRRVYGVFLLAVAARFWWSLPARAAAATPDAPVPPTPVSVLGLVAGVASGMFGIGGGAVIVPGLVLLLGVDQKRATGTSLAAFLAPVGLGATWAYWRSGALDLGVSALVAAGLVVGALAGANAAIALPTRTVQRLYALFLVGVGVRYALF